jgi:hypothetical protein
MKEKDIVIMLEQKLKGLEVSVDSTSVPFASSSVVEITDKKTGETFKSFHDYKSRIADVINGKIVAVYPHWDYSKSTSRHFNAFLNEFVVGGWSIAQMTRKEKEKYFEENNLFKELP